MADPKRPDSKRRSPTSRPAGSRAGKQTRKVTSNTASTARKDPGRSGQTRQPTTKTTAVEPIRQSTAATAEQQAEQRLGFTARRAAILAAVICVLTLTIAGPVRTFFSQRTEMKQLAATEDALRKQIAELESQKTKLADPVYIAAQARERLGFVMPGDVPYQVQLPPGAVQADNPGAVPVSARSGEPWYTALWKTIADDPHSAPPPPAAVDVPVVPGQVPEPGVPVPLPSTPGSGG